MTFKEVFKEIDYKYIFCVVFMKAIVPIIIKVMGISADKLGEVVEDFFEHTFKGKEDITDNKETTAIAQNPAYVNTLNATAESSELHTQSYSLTE